MKPLDAGKPTDELSIGNRYFFRIIPWQSELLANKSTKECIALAGSEGNRDRAVSIK